MSKTPSQSPDPTPFQSKTSSSADTTQPRQVKEILQARATSDGDGELLKRVFGGNDLTRFDPFLMLDEFGSDEAADYIGGFPTHPHRGFETVTYMLEGLMEHRDHMGNVGRLQPGGVQWMKAGSGVIHSDMNPDIRIPPFRQAKGAQCDHPVRAFGLVFDLLPHITRPAE